MPQKKYNFVALYKTLSFLFDFCGCFVIFAAVKY